MVTSMANPRYRQLKRRGLKASLRRSAILFIAPERVSIHGLSLKSTRGRSLLSPVTNRTREVFNRFWRDIKEQNIAFRRQSTPRIQPRGSASTSRSDESTNN